MRNARVNISEQNRLVSRISNRMVEAYGRVVPPSGTMAERQGSVLSFIALFYQIAGQLDVGVTRIP